MWSVFPTADYYEGSVAVGLAPRRHPTKNRLASETRSRKDNAQCINQIVVYGNYKRPQSRHVIPIAAKDRVSTGVTLIVIRQRLARPFEVARA
jgi:hypothetical protein